FDFSNMVNDPYMSFAFHYQGEACCDFAQAEISINGGQNWTKIGDGENGINWYNDNDENRWNGDGVAAGWSNVQNRLFGAAGRDSVRLRFVFESDHTNQGSGIGIDDIRIYEPYTIDLATAFVDHTSEIECGFDADKVLIAVENTGLNAVDQYLINYRFNGGPIVSESIFGIDVNDRDTFEFATPISTNMDGDYNVVAWVNAGGERNRVNDSLSLNFIIQGVKPLPLRQDFEDSDFPTGWTADEMNFGIDHGSPSSVFYDRLNIDDISFELLAPNVGTISTTDTLQFDYRIVNAVGNGTVGTSLSSGDQLLVQVSENCGINYANLLIIDPSNHVFSADMQTIKIGLETYVGKDIKIKFIGQRAAGDFFVDIDNVEINGCPMNLGLSLTQLNPSDLSSSDGSLSVQPTLGTSPYTYAWDNLSNTASLSDLAVGTYMVSVTDADGCMDTATSALEACPSSLGLTVTTTPESGLGNNGTAMVIASSGTAPYSFTWDSGVQTDMLYDLSLGSYFVTVTDNFGCADEIEAIVDLQTGNHIISDLIQFQLFPNPAQSESVINLELGSAKSVGLHVFNSLGQEILNEISSVSRQHFFTLDTSEYPNGIYFVKVIAGNQFVSKRLFVQH
ncbi:MAG: T9SS type A sorting domain-containing protein, partial [Bacteroidia bacterium]|nr:T9SS type A sorting domain-containing protein [Bacteroidia bacterium]